MAFVDKYPYTDFHELNLDWVLKKIKEVDKTVNDFTVFNKLTWAGVWSAAKSYVKWSIVQDENGNGYISIQPVPLNVPLTNEDYWQQIAKYEELYAAFDQRINNAQTTADNAQNSANNAQASADNAQASADNANTNALKRAYGHNYILVGDSFGGGIDGNNNSQSVNGGGWIERFKTATQGYCNVYNNQIPLGGVYGFASSRPFLDVIKDAATQVNDYNSITDIVCLGGTNDIGFPDYVIEEKVREFCSYCKENFKNAKISIGIIGSATLKLYQSGVYEGYKSCRKYGAHFIDTTMLLFCNKNYVGTDGTHLTHDGYVYYQPYINDAIISGECYYEQNLKAFGYWDNGNRFGISYYVYPRKINATFGHCVQDGDQSTVIQTALQAPFTTLANVDETAFEYNELSTGNVSYKIASPSFIIFDADTTTHGKIYYSFYYEVDIGTGTFTFRQLMSFVGFTASTPCILWSLIVTPTILTIN